VFIGINFRSSFLILVGSGAIYNTLIFTFRATEVLRWFAKSMDALKLSDWSPGVLAVRRTFRRCTSTWLVSLTGSSTKSKTSDLDFKFDPLLHDVLFCVVAFERGQFIRRRTQNTILSFISATPCFFQLNPTRCYIISAFLQYNLN